MTHGPNIFRKAVSNPINIGDETRRKLLYHIVDDEYSSASSDGSRRQNSGMKYRPRNETHSRPPAFLDFFFSLSRITNATSERRTIARSGRAVRDRKANRHAKSCRREVPQRALFFFSFSTDTRRWLFSPPLPSGDRSRVRGRRYLAGVISRHGLTHMCVALGRRPRRNEGGDATDGE